MARPLPSAFYARPLLGLLNVLGVALALASVVGALFDFEWTFAVPTFVVGVAWAALLRWPKTLGKTRVRVGWVASVPLGALNAALIGALAFGMDGDGISPILGALLGVTFGATLWVPAVAMTLLFFGVPIAYAQRLADRGLAGEERGERIVGIAVALIGYLAACRVRVLEIIAPQWSVLPNVPPESTFAIASVGGLAVVLGLVVVVLVTMRGRRRRAFVASVYRDEHAGYRVEDTSDGKFLVRVERHGDGYRVAEVEEALVELDDDGAARNVMARARD